jgi:hypothetical protein
MVAYALMQKQVKGVLSHTERAEKQMCLCLAAPLSIRGLRDRPVYVNTVK